MQRYLEGLVLTHPPFRPDFTCADVHRRFAEDQDLLSIAVVDRDRPVGLVHRHEFLLEMSGLFGRALFDKRPISLLMDKKPLLVDIRETVPELSPPPCCRALSSRRTGNMSGSARRSRCSRR